jgi:exosortase/archaeosortase family protein
MTLLNKFRQGVLSSDYSFVLLFLIYYGVFYVSSRVFLQLVTPGFYYSPFFDNNLNLIGAYRSFMLYMSSVICHIAGIPTFISGETLNMNNGSCVIVHFGCLGIDIISCWWAIVLAYPQTKLLKVKYFLAGTLGFICLNILRIGLLAILHKKSARPILANMEHHTLFNIVSYILLFALLYKWLKHPILKNAPTRE